MHAAARSVRCQTEEAPKIKDKKKHKRVTKVQRGLANPEHHHAGRHTILKKAEEYLVVNYVHGEAAQKLLRLAMLK